MRTHKRKQRANSFSSRPLSERPLFRGIPGACAIGSQSQEPRKRVILAGSRRPRKEARPTFWHNRCLLTPPQQLCRKEGANRIIRKTGYGVPPKGLSWTGSAFLGDIADLSKQCSAAHQLAVVSSPICPMFSGVSCDPDPVALTSRWLPFRLHSDLCG